MLFAAVLSPVGAVDAKIEAILSVDRHDAGQEHRHLVEDPRHRGV